MLNTANLHMATIDVSPALHDIFTTELLQRVCYFFKEHFIMPDPQKPNCVLYEQFQDFSQIILGSKRAVVINRRDHEHLRASCGSLKI